jgi:hypothetical protein
MTSDEILKHASLFTSNKRAELVTRNAAPLFAWVNAATDRDDQEARITALRRTYSNLNQMRDFEPHDNPEAFLGEARIYYDALTMGGEPYLTVAPDHVPDDITRRVLGEMAGEVDDDDTIDFGDSDTAE